MNLPVQRDERIRWGGGRDCSKNDTAKLYSGREVTIGSVTMANNVWQFGKVMTAELICVCTFQAKMSLVENGYFHKMYCIRPSKTVI